MKMALGVMVLALPLLAGCFGPQGNPNGQPYAGEPGGVIAVEPTPVGPPTYDPYAKAPVSQDMKAGGTGANQPPPPKPPIQ